MNTKTGYVYFFKSGDGLVKIGQTKNVENRFKALKTSCPQGIESLGHIKSNDYKQLEKALHYYFSDKRKNGEWFEIDNENVDHALNIKEGIIEIVQKEIEKKEKEKRENKEKNRNIVYLRLDKLTDEKRKKINDWLDAQSNMQESITNLVIHAIERFGNVEITDYNVQKALYSDTIQVATLPINTSTQGFIVEEKIEENDQLDASAITETPEQIDKKEEDNENWFASVDPNNL